MTCACSLRERSSWRGLRPLDEVTAMPVSMRRFRPATRTMKNSSRLEAKIAAKLARSISGRLSSWASSITRQLNLSQLSSRSKKRSSGSGASPSRASRLSSLSVSAMCSAIWLRRIAFDDASNICAIVLYFRMTTIAAHAKTQEFNRCLHKLSRWGHGWAIGPQDGAATRRAAAMRTEMNIGTRSIVAGPLIEGVAMCGCGTLRQKRTHSRFSGCAWRSAEHNGKYKDN